VNNLAPIELKFKWKKNGEPLDVEANKEKYEFVVEGDKYRLLVKDFDKKDEALYEIYLTEPDDYDISSTASIELEPKSGEHEETIEDITVTSEVTETEETLEDIEKRTKTPLKLEDCNVRKHETAVFELKLPAARSRVKWLKDGKTISINSKFDIEQGKTARLIIHDCLPADEGKYTAIVGDEEVSAELRVQGKSLFVFI
jgi:hypothetical protein